MLLLAWRNIVRNARRSLITVSAVAVGLASLLFLWGFNDGVHNAMMRNLQQVIVGSLQVHAADFFRHPKLTRTVPDAEAVRRLLENMGLQYTGRLRTFALAAGEETSEGLILLGMDPVRETRTTQIASKISRGRFFGSGHVPECILGRTTARNLGLEVGDELVVLTEDRFHSLAAEKFRLVGIIDSGEMGIDRGLAIIPLPFMQRMLGMEGEVSEWVVQLSPQQLEAVTARLRQALDERYEVLRWYDMYPMMKQWVDLENGFYYIFLSIVLIIVAAGIMNTVLMSMLDRIHEFGVMLALGCSRRRLAGMVLSESAILGLIGIGVGTLIGLALVGHFHGAGIDLSREMDTISRFYVDPVVHTEINTDHLADTVVAVLVAALLAGIWPALRAARLEPVEAIHHV